MNALLLVVDEHELFREGLVTLLLQRMPSLVLLQAGSLQQALQQLGAAAPIDLILLDPALQDSPGVPSLDALRKAHPLVPVLVLSAHDEPHHVQMLREHGAVGFLSKAITPARLCDAIYAVLAWQPSDPPQLAVGRDSDDSQTLSNRQQDVLQLLCEGKSNKVICRELQLSESTVKTHLELIFRKLGVRNRAQAVMAASRSGLLPSSQ